MYRQHFTTDFFNGMNDIMVLYIPWSGTVHSNPRESFAQVEQLVQGCDSEMSELQ